MVVIAFSKLRLGRVYIDDRDKVSFRLKNDVLEFWADTDYVYDIIPIIFVANKCHAMFCLCRVVAICCWGEMPIVFSKCCCLAIGFWNASFLDKCKLNVSIIEVMTPFQCTSCRILPGCNVAPYMKRKSIETPNFYLSWLQGLLRILGIVWFRIGVVAVAATAAAVTTAATAAAVTTVITIAVATAIAAIAAVPVVVFGASRV